MLIDSHCHLDRLDFSRYPNGVSDAIAAAHERGVDTMLCVCISKDNKDDVLAIAEAHERVFASVGVHPCDVNDVLVTIEQLKEWAKHSKVIALGESGLDYFHSKDFVEQQHRSFAAHLEAAGALKLPVIVHTRDARQDTLDLIKTHGNEESAGVLHCFTESWDMASKAMDMNYYISLSGIVTFKNAAELKDVARKLPLDRLLIETDSPYLAPIPYRGKPNEPKYVREVAEYVAELKGLSVEELGRITSDNFYRLFNRAKP